MSPAQETFAHIVISGQFCNLVVFSHCRWSNFGHFDQRWSLAGVPRATECQLGWSSHCRSQRSVTLTSSPPPSPAPPAPIHPPPPPSPALAPAPANYTSTCTWASTGTCTWTKFLFKVLFHSLESASIETGGLHQLWGWLKSRQSSVDMRCKCGWDA